MSAPLTPFCTSDHYINAAHQLRTKSSKQAQDHHSLDYHKGLDHRSHHNQLGHGHGLLNSLKRMFGVKTDGKTVTGAGQDASHSPVTPPSRRLYHTPSLGNASSAASRGARHQGDGSPVSTPLDSPRQLGAQQQGGARSNKAPVDANGFMVGGVKPRALRLGSASLSYSGAAAHGSSSPNSPMPPQRMPLAPSLGTSGGGDSPLLVEPEIVQQQGGGPSSATAASGQRHGFNAVSLPPAPSVPQSYSPLGPSKAVPPLSTHGSFNQSYDGRGNQGTGQQQHHGSAFSKLIHALTPHSGSSSTKKLPVARGASASQVPVSPLGSKSVPYKGAKVAAEAGKRQQLLITPAAPAPVPAFGQCSLQPTSNHHNRQASYRHADTDADLAGGPHHHKAHQNQQVMVRGDSAGEEFVPPGLASPTHQLGGATDPAGTAVAAALDPKCFYSVGEARSPYSKDSLLSTGSMAAHTAVPQPRQLQRANQQQQQPGQPGHVVAAAAGAEAPRVMTSTDDAGAERSAPAELPAVLLAMNPALPSGMRRSRWALADYEVRPGRAGQAGVVPWSLGCREGLDIARHPASLVGLLERDVQCGA